MAQAAGDRWLCGAGGALISVLDWFREPDGGPTGNFVQRIIDGDALEVISRKAVASADTIASIVGFGALLIGVVSWIVIFRYVVPRISRLPLSTRRC